MAKRAITWAAAVGVVGLVGAWGALSAKAAPVYFGSRFRDVWAEVKSNPYRTLPQEKVSITKFFSWGTNLLERSAKRTIASDDDVLPRFDKLVHPNGICLKGTWNVTETSPYTGYFEQGKQAVIIARASTALSGTTRSTYRGFGMAVKLFPTSDPNHTARLKTANFFVIDDLGGTDIANYLDAPMTNEPNTSIRFSSLLIAPIAAAATTAFTAADKNPGIRQLYPVAELGLAAGRTARAPKYIQIKGAAYERRQDKTDFRDELNIALYKGYLDFDVMVSETKTGPFQRIGYLEFTESVTSDSCDHRIHFHHPKFR
jgi:hypothetical protein